MFRGKKSLSGQSVIEYVLVIGVVIMVLMGMSNYMRRGIEGVVKDMSDQIGNQNESAEVDPLKGVKIESSSNITSTSSGKTTIISSAGGGRQTVFNYSTNNTGDATFVSNETK